MPFYTDPQFNVTLVKLPPIVTGTATASATNGVAVTSQLFTTLQKIDISKIRVVVHVAPKTGTMALVVNIMNGTDTVGAVAMSTKTAIGDYKDATLTTNTRVLADANLTAVVTGTATASADTIGSMLVEIYETPVFV
jgi:hypothetical protein